MKRIKNLSFFKQDAETLAKKLLGKYLCVKQNNKIERKKITETECYFEFDSACHAFKGKTKRNENMFKIGGTIYIYLIYGIYYMLNISSGEEHKAQAVLIRGVENLIGPGKLTKFFGIDMSFNGENLINSNKIWLEEDLTQTQINFISKRRVGIDYATEKDKARLWRFILKDN